MGNKAKQYYVYGIFLIIILVGFFLYKSNFRFTDNFWIAKVGTLNINLTEKDATIIIDKKTKVNAEKNVETFSLSPQTHDIIISKEGYFPWTKKIKIKSNDTVSLTPFFISQNASGQIITVNDPEYWKIKDKIEKYVLPDSKNPLQTPNGDIIWVENNAILMKSSGQIHTVIEPDTVIKNISLYKNRGDVIIFSTYNAIYAIETSTEGTQNFMPIYKGTEPRFILGEGNSLYVLDKDLLMQVVI